MEAHITLISIPIPKNFSYFVEAHAKHCRDALFSAYPDKEFKVIFDDSNWRVVWIYNPVKGELGQTDVLEAFVKGFMAGHPEKW